MRYSVGRPVYKFSGVSPLKTAHLNSLAKIDFRVYTAKLGFALWKLLFVAFSNLLVKKPSTGQVSCSLDRGHSITLNPVEGAHKIFGFCGG